jgi:lysozyme
MTYWQPANRFGGVIDVSHHNGAIDWSKVAAAGNAFSFVKATQGDGYVDPMFATNVAAARAAGLMAVPYHFLTEDDIHRQLANLVAVARLGAGAAVMIDWETDPRTGRRPPIATMEGFSSLVRAIIGREPLAYHGMYDLSSSAINAYPWMVPKYGPQPQGPRWLFWQDTDRADVPGIPSVGEDHSWFAGTLDELRAWYRDGALPVDVVSAPTKPQPTTQVSQLKEGEGVLQRVLQVNGFDPGAIDGVIGRNTLRALAHADPATASALAAYRRGEWNI